jgi:Chemotaxis signal transduction protein
MTEAAATTLVPVTGAGEDNNTYVTFLVGGQRFGVPVFRVQDILAPERISPVPLAPAAVKGSINLRGRIVTVVDVRTRLGLAEREEGATAMGVTVEQHSELYTLLVDRIGDIVDLPASHYEERPSTLEPSMRETTTGVYRLDDGLVVVLDIDRLLDLN